jgi:Zinc finger, C3HC4 type (RING finger)
MMSDIENYIYEIIDSDTYNTHERQVFMISSYIKSKYDAEDLCNFVRNVCEKVMEVDYHLIEVYVETIIDYYCNTIGLIMQPSTEERPALRLERTHNAELEEEKESELDDSSSTDDSVPSLLDVEHHGLTNTHTFYGSEDYRNNINHSLTNNVYPFLYNIYSLNQDEYNYWNNNRNNNSIFLGNLDIDNRINFDNHANQNSSFISQTTYIPNVTYTQGRSLGATLGLISSSFHPFAYTFPNLLEEDDDEDFIEPPNPKIQYNIVEKEENNSQECEVCYLSKEDKEFGKLQCNHMFCSNCLKEIFTHPLLGYKCPMCRVKITNLEFCSSSAWEHVRSSGCDLLV